MPLYLICCVLSQACFIIALFCTGEHYKYEWTFLAQPEGVNSGIMNDQNGETLKLSHLIEGLYMFKVSVSAPGAYGETYANVTVLPCEYYWYPVETGLWYIFRVKVTVSYIQGCIQKFPDWLPGARTANGTAICQ
jgi:hypothetical protein